MTLLDSAARLWWAWMWLMFCTGWAETPKKLPIRSVTYWLDPRTFLVSQYDVEQIPPEANASFEEIKTVCLNRPLDQKTFICDTKGLKVVQAYSELGELPQTNQTTQPIHGEVFDLSGKPMANVLVLPLPEGGKPVVTDERGNFEMPGPSKTRLIFQLFARDEKHNLAAKVDVPENHIGHVQMTLKPAATLSGRVVDNTGRPVKGANVWPIIPKMIRGKDELGNIGFGLSDFHPSDDEGRYKIKALPIQQAYSLGVSARGFGRNWLDIGMIHEPGERKLDDLVIQPANSSITGIVLGDKDQPMPGIHVQASGKFQPIMNVRTEADGRFEINGIIAGPLSLFAQGPDQSWSSGSDEFLAGERDVELYLEKRGSKCMVQSPVTPELLTGKAIPSLDELNVPIKAEDLRGKRILICFFKIDDPSSRNAMRHLAEITDDLSRKNTAILGVEIWDRNEVQFHRWLNRNKIVFPVGMLRGEWDKLPEQRVTYRWGVGGRVPWLVIMDSKHVVCAEGFDLEDLDEISLVVGSK